MVPFLYGAVKCNRLHFTSGYIIQFYNCVWIQLLVNQLPAQHAILQPVHVPCYPVWLGRLTHLLREARSHWPPFFLHSQLCKNDTRADYQQTPMPRNWNEYFKCLWTVMQTRPFSAGVNLWSSSGRGMRRGKLGAGRAGIGTITFKNRGHCVRAMSSG